jgi:hypothetical protein
MWNVLLAGTVQQQAMHKWQHEPKPEASQESIGKGEK